MWTHECEHRTSQRSQRSNAFSRHFHLGALTVYFFFKAKKKKEKKSKGHCLNLTNRCFLTQKKKNIIEFEIFHMYEAWI